MSPAGIGESDIERLLEETRRTLGALRSGGPGAGSGTAEPVRGEGMAADGRVTVRVVAGGRLEGLSVDPRLLRQGSEELCAQIMVAVNAAMGDLRARTAEAAPATMDVEALAGMLEELQGESARQMRAFTQGIAEMVAKISASTER